MTSSSCSLSTSRVASETYLFPVPGASDIEMSAALYQELLLIRYSSSLFRLRTAEDVKNRVAFHNTGPDQLPGLIAMSLSDLLEPDLDRGHEMFVVLINANDQSQSISIEDLIGKDFVLHLVQFGSVDGVVKQATFDSTTGTFNVPARTTAVFEYSPQEMLRSLIDEGVLSPEEGQALLETIEALLTQIMVRYAVH